MKKLMIALFLVSVMFCVVGCSNAEKVDRNKSEYIQTETTTAEVIGECRFVNDVLQN